MVKLLILLCFILMLGGCSPARSDFPFTTIGSILHEPEMFANREVRITGTFQRSHGTEPHEIQGFFHQDDHRIQVKGTVFDWLPPEGVILQFWGKVEVQNETPIFVFYNGRNLGNLFRRPQPLPPLTPGQQTTLLGRITIQEDGFVLVSEDLRKVKLLNFTPPADLSHLLKIKGIVMEFSPMQQVYKVQVDKIIDTIYIFPKGG